MLIENAHREAGSALRAHLNTITVSKKRNWLQQSSSGSCPAEEVGPGSEEHQQQHPVLSPPPTLGVSPDGQQPRPAPFPRPSLRLPLPLVTITHGHSHARVSPQPPRPSAADAAEEENDADDEGEIWYNPIPEDDEPEPPKPLPLSPRGGPSAGPAISAKLQGQPETSQHPHPLRRPSGGDAAGESLAGPSSLPPSSLLSVEAAHALHLNAAHSSEPPQLHRQMFACRSQEESLTVSKPTAPGMLHRTRSFPLLLSLFVSLSFSLSFASKVFYVC